jgi:hypothetical protein
MAIQLCPPLLIDKVLTETFSEPLFAAGFQKVRPRLYVRSRIREMNDVIEFYRSRFTWGLSLNFVPHITRGVENVRWHRTPKSAVKDIGYSGLGKVRQIGSSIDTARGEDSLRRSARLMRAEMLPTALHFFRSINGFGDLSWAFQDAARPDEWGWTLEMRPQLHLAYAFYLAKAGREGDARQMLSAWLSRHFKSYRPETLEEVSQKFQKTLESPYILQ